MSETRKLAAILVADVVGYSRLAGTDEERTLARLRGLRSDLIDPAIAAHHGRVVKRTGDGIIIDFRSVVEAVRCAIEVQTGMLERNAGLPNERRIQFRVGVHLGDVVEESDGDLMGDGVNIAARLEGVAKPGAICLSEDAYRQVTGRLEMAVNDLGLTELKNIDKSIRVYSVEVGKPAHARAAAPRRLSLLAPVFAALMILAAAGAWYLLGANRTATVQTNVSGPVGSNVAPAEPAHLSIVVLPFKNLSGDAGQDYFADGVTDNLITELSRIRNSFVIASTTAFTYKGKSVDAKQIGKELDVRYVLEGSVQRDQNRVRVNAQLIDAESGAHLWADRFDEDVADLFKLQDQVVARLANTLGNELLRAEVRKGNRSKNPDTIDLDMRSRALLQQYPPTKDDNVAARELAERALKINPDDADALSAAAYTYFRELVNGWAEPNIDYEAKVLSQVNRAIALAPDNVWAYFVKTAYLRISQRPEEAIGAANAGLAINPNSALLYGGRSVAEIYLGRFEPAKTDAEQAMRLSPRDPRTGLWHGYIGLAEFGQGHDDAAIAEYRRALDAGYRSSVTYLRLGAALALQGKMEEAKTAVAEALRLNPSHTVKQLIETQPNLPRLFEGLRKTELPEE
jgi:adenylate cyclase